VWFELEKGLILRLKVGEVQFDSDMELDTVLGSNLSKYITPELGLELSTLKEHLGINSFYVFQQ